VEIGKNIRAKMKQMIRTRWERLRRNTRRVLRILPYVLLAAGAGLCIFSAIRMDQIKTEQSAQIAAEQWAGDSGRHYVQLSCFARGQQQANGSPDLILDASVSLVKNDIVALRTAMDDLVRVASGVSSKSKSASEKKNSDTAETVVRLWFDAYSSEAKCTVVRPSTDISGEISNETTLTGVGGDYDLFHPLMLIEGSFLSEDSTDPQTIVLDESLSWLLFGSYHSVGQDVTINGISYNVVGVVRKSDKKIDKNSYGDLPRAYVLFDELARIFPSSSELTAGNALDGSSEESPSFIPDASNLAIQCYEVVLPNQLDGIARQNLISAMTTAGKDTKNYLIVQNTGRFSLLKLYDALFPIGANEAKRTQYKLPFWEISAEIAESVLVFWWAMISLGVTLALTSALTIYTARKKSRTLRV